VRKWHSQRGNWLQCVPLFQAGHHEMQDRSPIDALWKAASQGPRLAGRGLVKVYQYTLSPLIGYECRHLPTCSAYADEALQRHGLWAGGWMTLARLCRCHPYGTHGLDFVPECLPADAAWFTPWRYGRWRGVNAAPPAPTRAATDPAASE